MKHGIFLLGLLVAGVVQAEIFWPNSDFEQGGEVPSGYTTPSGDLSMTRWAEPAASGSHSLGIVDTKTDTFAKWVSDRVVLPQSAIGKTIQIKCKELFNMADGYARVSVTFHDSSGKGMKDGATHFKMEGASEGWDSEKFTEATQTVNVPPQAVSMRIALVSAGGMKATGEVYIDDLEVIYEGSDVATERSEVKAESPKTPLQSLSREYKARPSTVRDYQLHQPEINASAKAVNIIFILADDMGWGDISCYPTLKPEDGFGSDIQTPRIDSLAKRGVRFTNGYADHMVCAPTRAAIMSGRSQAFFGFDGFAEAEADFPDDIVMLPKALKKAGYVTGMMGKWHIGEGDGDRPLDQGFDRFYGFLGGQHDFFDPRNGSHFGVPHCYDAPVLDQETPVKKMDYLTDELTDQAMDFIGKAEQGDAPFFVYLAYNTPHAPLQVPWKWLEKYADKRGELGVHSRDISMAMIDNLDWNVGRLLDYLEERKLMEDTLIVFASDNGASQQCYTGGLKGRKGFFFEGGIRVPLIACWSGTIPPGQVCDEPVVTHDLYKTFLGAANVKNAPQGVQGVNWLPRIAGTETPWPQRQLFWTIGNKNVKWAVRDQKWKLVNDDACKEYQAWPREESRNKLKSVFKTQLFDLNADPMETTDLSAQYPEVAQRLQTAMDAFHKECAPSLATSDVKSKIKEKLRVRKDNPEKYPEAYRIDGAPGHERGPHEIVFGAE